MTPPFRPSDIDFNMPHTPPWSYRHWPPLCGMFGQVEAEIFISIVTRVRQVDGDDFSFPTTRSLALHLIPNNFAFDKSLRRNVMDMSLVDWGIEAHGIRSCGWVTVEDVAGELGVKLTPGCIEKLRTSPFSRVASF